MKTAPEQKIVYSSPATRRTRMGIRTLSVLECGHADHTYARDRRRGWITCFACYYDKPRDYTAEEIAERGWK